jgi:ABC-type glycerol-3-phosphate transport system substrate-binding protein
MKEIVNDFNAGIGAEKHIFVRYVSISAINQKTLIATAAGVPPDVAGLWDTNLAQFAAQDALEPLDDLATEHGITAATYKPVYWDACHYDGKLYALISTPATVALHYNKKLFHEQAASLRAAGLDPDRAPATIDELGASRCSTPRSCRRSPGCKVIPSGWAATRSTNSAAVSPVG